MMGPSARRCHWAPFAQRARVIGQWLAVWWIPRAEFGAFVVCDYCGTNLTRYTTVCVTTYPAWEDWLVAGWEAIPEAGNALCRACARRGRLPRPSAGERGPRILEAGLRQRQVILVPATDRIAIPGSPAR